MKVVILKILGQFLKIFGRGSSLVGYLDSKLNLNVLKDISFDNVEVIFVTGTNGKTSLVNIINKLYKDENKKIISNLEGANLISGIKTSLIMNIKNKKLDADILLLEVDEKTVSPLAKIIKPNHLLLSNFFRDQLDRYFEISLIIEEVIEVIKKYKPTVYFNGQDPMLYAYLKELKDVKQINYFLENDELAYQKNKNIVEIKYCPVCVTKLEYRYYHYAHIGDYYCPNCGFKVPHSQFKLKYQKETNDLIIKTKNDHFIINLKEENIPKYMLINYSLIVTYLYGKIKNETISMGLKNVKMPKGRNNIYYYQGNKIYLNLAKNVVGMEQTIKFLVDNNEKINLLIAFNDNYADGKDVSWIWDVNFLPLINKLEELHIVGLRRHDMQLRFLYEKFTNIKIYETLGEGMDCVFARNKDFAIITNYTPLSSINEYIKNKVENKDK